MDGAKFAQFCCAVAAAATALALHEWDRRSVDTGRGMVFTSVFGDGDGQWSESSTSALTSLRSVVTIDTIENCILDELWLYISSFPFFSTNPMLQSRRQTLPNRSTTFVALLARIRSEQDSRSVLKRGMVLVWLFGETAEEGRTMGREGVVGFCRKFERSSFQTHLRNLCPTQNGLTWAQAALRLGDDLSFKTTGGLRPCHSSACRFFGTVHLRLDACRS
ncbi:hypothetical protein SCHPADRAFT_892284 [Schizopora paradoxa]|uniref:Uncharacterized protein n=1 Tax=Schizopora paradoxa TaxID=27342 RepID=A0A0H2RM15_9AGAM|nr:hypothetical protein SCHPADRAFT_892284 [Schizopora paradoxa]